LGTPAGNFLHGFRGLLYSVVIAAVFWPIGPVIFVCGLVPFVIQGYRTAH
jgi:hypothetical protein